MVKCHYFHKTMKTLKKIIIEPVFVETMPLLQDMEIHKVYISEKHSLSCHICLCGCETKVVMPLNEPQWWQLVKELNGTVSFIGSVLQHPCEAHYIITKNVANFC